MLICYFFKANIVAKCTKKKLSKSFYSFKKQYFYFVFIFKFALMFHKNGPEIRRIKGLLEL